MLGLDSITGFILGFESPQYTWLKNMLIHSTGDSSFVYLFILSLDNPNKYIFA